MGATRPINGDISKSYPQAEPPQNPLGVAAPHAAGNQYSCGFTTIRGVAVGMDKPLLESTCKIRPKPIKPFKGKATTTRARTLGPGKRGVVVVFFEFLESPSEARPEHLQYRPSGRQRRGSTPRRAYESAARHNGQGGQGDVPVAQPGTNGQNPVLQTSKGTDLARQGAYHPLGRVFLAWEYPDLHNPRLTQWRAPYWLMQRYRVMRPDGWWPWATRSDSRSAP